VHGKSAEPRASKDRRQITGAIWQPQRHPRAGADAGFAKPGRRTEHALVKGLPIKRAGGVADKASRWIAA